MTIDCAGYPNQNLHDELIDERQQPRPVARALLQHLASFSDGEIGSLIAAANLAIKEMGISFTVYTEAEGSIDRAWPFDLLPRIMAKREWDGIERGLKQRVKALNLFIDDLYHEQRIITDGVFPRELLDNSQNFRPQCMGVDPPLGIWAHICGSDLVRDRDGTVYVLEDNLRVPSGVSYMLENRQVLKRVFPELFENYNIQPVDDYSSQLFDTLTALSPRPVEFPQVVVLTPGIYNSAYFEHAYLAQQMGCELVEGRDLVVDKDDIVYMQTMTGLQRVDVIYRRIDDLFMDPEAFNPTSLLGVPGLMRAWKAGNVALANAPGAGVADDKVVYAFVPEVIRYYLGEEIALPNVPTYLCMRPSDREYVLDHLAELVVKPANESGGYGMLIGPHASRKELAQFARLIQENPRNYIAQPTLSLSTVPTLVDQKIEPRHVDLRPFILSGRQTFVTMGGLTQVALRKGSLVVNSSQGGGSKDTWIVDEGEPLMLLARVAENLYWMGRYLERAENLARLINVNSHLLLDLPKGIAPGWRPLIEITGNMALYSERQSEFDEVRVLRFLVTADDNPGSILASLYYARENARTIRDIIPREAWELINALHHYARENQTNALSKRGRFDYLNQIILRNQTLTGCLVGTMNRDAGYTFVSLGQNIERADMTSRFIDVQSANLIDDGQPEEHPHNAIQWISVLKSLSGYQAYRRAMQVRVRRTAVLRFLLQHREFPRAVRHTLGKVAESLHGLPNHDRPLALARRLEQDIEQTDVERLSQQALHQLIDELQLGLGALSQAIADCYFLKAHSGSEAQPSDASGAA